LNLERKLLQTELPLKSQLEALKTVYLSAKNTVPCKNNHHPPQRKKETNKETKKQTS
jgi:hypothetical protein